MSVNKTSINWLLWVTYDTKYIHNETKSNIMAKEGNDIKTIFILQ